jgi:hypothetical protein
MCLSVGLLILMFVYPFYLCHCLSMLLSVWNVYLCHCLSMLLSICFVIQIQIHVSRIIVMCHHPFSRNLKVKLLFFIFPEI